MGLSGLDFMTVAANFLDSYSRTRRADLDFKRDAGRQDQLISAERQYQSGVREGERAFQSQQAQGARDFQRSESDREWGRGADARALQEQLQRQQLGMTTAQFEEWKSTAPGRAEMAKLEGDKTRAEINRLNAEAGHYRTMGGSGGGGGGGGRASNPNAVTPGERWQDDLDKKASMLLRQMKLTGPDGEALPEEEIQAKVDLAYRMAKNTMPPQPNAENTVAGPPTSSYVPGSRPFTPPENPEYDINNKQAFNEDKFNSTVGIVEEDAKAAADRVWNMDANQPMGFSLPGGDRQGPRRADKYGDVLRSYQDEFAKRAKVYVKKDPMYQGNKTAAQKRADAYGQ